MSGTSSVVASVLICCGDFYFCPGGHWHPGPGAHSDGRDGRKGVSVQCHRLQQVWTWRAGVY